MQLIKKITTLFHPERFQGWGKRRAYFEGWYFKLVSQDQQHAYAIIPGLAFDNEGTGHAFIQLLDGKRKTSAYHKFPLEFFKANAKAFEVSIGNNLFTGQNLILDLPELNGEIQFENVVGWPKPFYSPGIMGPYAFAPFMECYHGIVSMDHELNGTLVTHVEKLVFNGGRGYIEKDWGKSFPSAYVWMQSNHFEEPGISLKASVAMIPWMTGEFVGFIAGFWLKDRLIQFTTYNRSRLIRHVVTNEHVHLVLENPKYTLEINGERDETTELASPIQGAMAGKIEETMGANLYVVITERRTGSKLFEGTGTSAGLEVAGAVANITTGP